jgi:UDP-2,3-diacylglucosamine hydrolase
MGDLFDFWFEYKYVVPKGYVRLLATLAKLADKGIPVTLFKGNHDMWMFGYLEKECGVKIISESLTFERNGLKFYLHHGDGLGPGDRMYKFVRSVFRSRWAQWMFARIHPNLGFALGNYFSRKSRISQKNLNDEYLGDSKEFITQFCKENQHNYNFMIFGHRHLTLDIKISETCRYINTGEWVNGRGYAVFNGTDVVLKEVNT